MIHPKAIIILTLWILFCLNLTGQSVIKGEVIDKNLVPIIGANIYFQNSYEGTTSDYHGKFTLTTTMMDSQILVISYLGFKTATDTLLLIEDTIDLKIILQEESHTLDDVVITAGSFTGGGERSREILQPQDIVTTAGATADIAGALNTLPGTQVVGEAGRLYVRGGEGYETKTFIDGMQVLGFYAPTAPNTPSRSRFMPYMFNGTSFSTGGYSAEYGQALSSALILHSKFLALEDRIDISMMSVGGDIAVTRSWENASLVAKTQYTNLRPYNSLITQSLDWIDHPTSYEGSAAFRQKISDTGVLKAFTNINRSSFSLNRPDILYPELFIYTKVKNNYDYFNAVLHEEWSKNWTIKGGVSYTSDINDIVLDRQKVNEKNRGWHLKTVLHNNSSAIFSLKLGGELFYQKFSQEYHDPSTSFSHLFQYADHLSAAFVESQFMISESLASRSGVRVEYSALRKTLSLAPRLSLAWKLSQQSQVSAAFGLFRQAPQRQYLMVNDELKDETSMHYILNYEYIRHGQSFRVELFQKSYDELVKFDSQRLYDRQGYNNTGQGYARGIDFFWRDSRSFSGLDYWISYSYLDSQRDYGDFPYLVSPSYTSNHNLSLVGKYFIGALRSSFGVTFKMASGRPYNDPNTNLFMAGKTPVYQDLSGNVSVLLRQNLILHISATNILGRDHIYSYEFSAERNEEHQYAKRAIGPVAKRFLFVGLFWTISNDQIVNQLPYL